MIFAEASYWVYDVIQTRLPYRGIQSEQRGLFHYEVVYAFDVDFHIQLFMTQILVLAFSYCRVHCII